MRERSMGKVASLGKEAVLADSGRAGEVSARVGRVRKATFSASCMKHKGREKLKATPTLNAGQTIYYLFGCGV